MHRAHVQELVEVEEQKIPYDKVQAESVAVHLLEREGHELVHHVKADVGEKEGKHEEQELSVQDVLDNVHVRGVTSDREERDRQRDHGDEDIQPMSESDRDTGMCDCSSLKSIMQTLDLI